MRLCALPDINAIVGPQIYYYRCLGSDKYRGLAGPVCDNRPVRQDLLDEVVWMEIVRLLEDPQLIQIELDRRLQAGQRADPTKRREDALRRNLLRIRKSIERLLTAYQEGLISLDELRQRMPDLRMREQTDQAELQAIADQSVNALRAYVSRKRSRISSPVCAHRPEPSASQSVSVFFGFW